jgi:hypothetical protein
VRLPNNYPNPATSTGAIKQQIQILTALPVLILDGEGAVEELVNLQSDSGRASGIHLMG